MQSSVMPDLSIELEETHNRRLFNRFVAWLCHDTLFWEQKSLANFEFFVPLPHFNGFNGLDYEVSSFCWFIQGPNHEFSSDKTKSNRRPFEDEGFVSIAMKCRQDRGLADITYDGAPVLCTIFEKHLPPRKKKKKRITKI